MGDAIGLSPGGLSSVTEPHLWGSVHNTSPDIRPGTATDWSGTGVGLRWAGAEGGVHSGTEAEDDPLFTICQPPAWISVS